MALSTYLNYNVTNDPILVLAVDTTVATAPADRPSTFTPTGGYVAVPASQDYGVGATPAVRPKCFEGLSIQAQIDPGLIVNG